MNFDETHSPNKIVTNSVNQVIWSRGFPTLHLSLQGEWIYLQEIDETEIFAKKKKKKKTTKKTQKTVEKRPGSATAFPRHQEEEETDKSKQAQTAKPFSYRANHEVNMLHLA